VLIDSRTLTTDQAVAADICIVGAGAAGITLARELAGSSVSVCVLESGGLEFDEETQTLAAGDNVGLAYTDLTAARVRQFGGSTNHWAGWCWPLDEIDFAARDWVPHSGWPFTKRELDPYYARAQAVCELGPYNYDPALWEVGGRGRLPVDAARLETKIVQFSPPTRFGDAYRAELTAAANVATYLFANFVAFETNEDSSVVMRAQVKTLAGNSFTVSARLFVLAAGGIDNARLLLQPTPWRPQGIGNENDVVGRFFSDHPGMIESIVVITNPAVSTALYAFNQAPATLTDMLDGGPMGRFLATPEDRDLVLAWIGNGMARDAYDRDVKTIVDRSCVPCHSPSGIAFYAPLGTYDDLVEAQGSGGEATEQRAARPVAGALVLAPEAQRRERVLNARSMIDIRATWSAVIDGDSFADSVMRVAGNLGGLADATYRKLLDPESARPLRRLRTAIEPAPNPDSRVLLGDERDRLGLLKARLDWRLGELDRHTFERTEALVAEELARAEIGRIVKQAELPEDAWPSFLRHGWHHMGTTRMHVDPRQGVVDADCRVHGVSNLYVAGSSVFPTYGYANPTLTIVAMAIRLADRLKESL
jgi:choline dehydrogenase-like flavoprotein